MKRILVLAVAAIALGMGLASAPEQAGDCTPTCYKHPITGELICSYPCP